MSRPAPRVTTLRWRIAFVRVSNGRPAGLKAWSVSRVNPLRASVPGAVFTHHTHLGYFETLPAAMERARKDCAMFYDERSRP